MTAITWIILVVLSVLLPMIVFGTSKHDDVKKDSWALWPFIILTIYGICYGLAMFTQWSTGHYAPFEIVTNAPTWVIANIMLIISSLSGKVTAVGKNVIGGE